MIQSVSGNYADMYAQKNLKTASMPQERSLYTKEDLNNAILDYYVKSEIQDMQKTDNCEDINFFRLVFNRLTKEQIEAINETKELPKGSKIAERKNEDGSVNLCVTWNIADITAGTQKLPAGYELKNDIFGFTHVVREGTKGIMYKD